MVFYVTKRSWDGVAGGATDAVVDTWNDLVHMVEDPKGTLQSIGEGAQAVWDDPKGVAKTIGNEMKDSWNEQVINGDAKSRGHYFSYLTANVAISIVGTKGADKLAKTTKLEQLSGAATKKLNEGAAAIHVHTQSALQNLGLNKLDNRLAYPGVGSVKGNGGYQFIERVDGGNGVGTKVRDESGKGTDDVTPKKKSVPDWLKERWEAGNNFNKENRPRYPYNEVELEAKEVGGKKYVVDSYAPNKEIVSRKFTQLSEVQEKTAKSYLNEITKKYSSGSKISNGTFNPNALKGGRLKGELILEIPVQNKPIPQTILDEATKNRIIIRDIKGKVYN
ncbi:MULTISPECIES: hypothetical protein [Priestia]|uniref:hypothetical protein n=1 Tax=Priestia TaxID=2800373 RepID=UPI000815E7A8|nr:MULTISPECIES: hypothetical protein [Priestia]SCC51327.1 hypothetical protein GA0061087_10697 [Priestia flexa]